jgi:hypothetical protein
MKTCLLCKKNYKYREGSSYCSNDCEDFAVQLWLEHPYANKYNSLEENTVTEDNKINRKQSNNYKYNIEYKKKRMLEDPEFKKRQQEHVAKYQLANRDKINKQRAERYLKLKK